MQKVLIIKLGYSETLDPEISYISSLGDVLRTTVVLHHFKNDHVTWLVDEKASKLLEGNPYINRILIYNIASVLQLQKERYDTVINFEKVPGICALASSINAWRRFGFRFDEIKGEAAAYDQCEYVFSLCKNINLKKFNNKSWQENLLEIIGVPWQNQEYILGYKPKSDVIYDIGFNWAVGSKWLNKAWPKDKWMSLEKMLSPKYKISWQKGLKDIYEYIEWLNSCKLIITNDSLGLHIAIALKKHVIILYGPTNPAETYFYGRGIPIYPEGKYDCMPCFLQKCHQKIPCISQISVEKVYNTVEKVMNSIDNG